MRCLTPGWSWAAAGLTTLVCLLTGAPGSAEVYAPRLVGPRDPDGYSLSTLAAEFAARHSDDAARAAAVFAWLTDPNRGLRLVERGVWEGADPVPEFGLVGDPLKTLAVYGYGDRRALAGTLAAIWTTGGWGRARLALRADTRQLVSELEVAGAWRAFDVAARETVAGSTVQPRYFPVPRGHTLGFVLRRGERFTQWWSPQGERWHLTEAEAKDARWREALEALPRGPKAIPAANEPVYTQGQLIYEPLLRGRPHDFADGVTFAANVEVTSEGLTLREAGEGSAVFLVQSPYVLVPEVGKLDDPKDDREASVVELDGSHLSVSYSRNAGATWLALETKSFPARLDLTPQVAGGYGYWLRIDFQGEPGHSVLRSLRITSWVQMARRSLPAVHPGRNRFVLKTGDSTGRNTFPVVIDAPTHDENGFLRPVIRPPRTFQPGDPGQRVIGPFTARVSAPPQSRIAWFTAGGSFAFALETPAATTADLAFAVEQPASFQPLALPALPADHAHAHYHHDLDVPLEQPARVVYFRGEGRPALNQFRVTAHCLRDQPRDPSLLRITHRWKSANQPQSFSVELTEPGAYEFEAGTDVVNESVEFFVPGGEH